MMFPSLSNRPSLSSRHSGLASSRERLRPLLLLATVWLGAALVHQDVSWLDAGLGGIALVAALLRLRERPAQGDDTAHPSPVRCHGRRASPDCRCPRTRNRLAKCGLAWKRERSFEGHKTASQRDAFRRIDRAAAQDVRFYLQRSADRTRPSRNSRDETYETTGQHTTHQHCGTAARTARGAAAGRRRRRKHPRARPPAGRRFAGWYGGSGGSWGVRGRGTGGRKWW